MIRKLYPHGKKKAFNVTYDDGVLQDVRFVALLNQYQIKGTFNLNSGLMENGFAWTHESGCLVRRLKTENIASLYAGHEIASHTLTHPYMHSLAKEEIMRELSEDKVNLEKLFGEPIRGFAVPFDYYSDLIEQCVKECGFEYARISEESHSFQPHSDFYRWRATVFHCDERLLSYTQQFLQTDEELALFQIVGHTYDLDVENKWDMMESIFKAMRRQDDILPMTTVEVIDYLKAMNKAVITKECIRNNSDMSLWFSVGNTVWEVKPGETVFPEKLPQVCIKKSNE